MKMQAFQKAAILTVRLKTVLFSQALLFKRVAVIRNSILMPGVTVGPDSLIEYTIIAADTVIGSNVKLGSSKEPVENGKHPEISVIGQDIVIADDTVIPAGAMVGVKALQKRRVNNHERFRYCFFLFRTGRILGN